LAEKGPAQVTIWLSAGVSAVFWGGRGLPDGPVLWPGIGMGGVHGSGDLERLQPKKPIALKRPIDYHSTHVLGTFGGYFRENLMKYERVADRFE